MDKQMEIIFDDWEIEEYEGNCLLFLVFILIYIYNEYKCPFTYIQQYKINILSICSPSL